MELQVTDKISLISLLGHRSQNSTILVMSIVKEETSAITFVVHSTKFNLVDP